MKFGFRLHSKTSESSIWRCFEKIVKGFTLPFQPLFTLLLIIIVNDGNTLTDGSCKRRCLQDKMDSL